MTKFIDRTKTEKKEVLEFKDVVETIKIPELNLEVTRTQEWTKPYNKIIVPEGWRKIKVQELWFILDGSKYVDDFLGDFKGKWNRFWCEQTHYDKENNYSRWLCSDDDLVCTPAMTTCPARATVVGWFSLRS